MLYIWKWFCLINFSQQWTLGLLKVRHYIGTNRLTASQFWKLWSMYNCSHRDTHTSLQYLVFKELYNAYGSVSLNLTKLVLYCLKHSQCNCLSGSMPSFIFYYLYSQLSVMFFIWRVATYGGCLSRCVRPWVGSFSLESKQKFSFKQTQVCWSYLSRCKSRNLWSWWSLRGSQAPELKYLARLYQGTILINKGHANPKQGRNCWQIIFNWFKNVSR